MEEQYDARALVLSFFGPLFVFIGLLAAQEYTDIAFLNTSFGAAVVILFALQSPSGRPAHIFIGQTIAGIIGICFRLWIPIEYKWLSGAFGVATCTFVLKCLRICYPPAGATTFLITQTTEAVTWWYLLFPLFVGNVIMFVIAFTVINLMYSTRKSTIR